MTKEQFFSDDIGDWVVETNKKYPNLTIDEFCKMFEEWFEKNENSIKLNESIDLSKYSKLNEGRDIFDDDDVFGDDDGDDDGDEDGDEDGDDDIFGDDGDDVDDYVVIEPEPIDIKPSEEESELFTKIKGKYLVNNGKDYEHNIFNVVNAWYNECLRQNEHEHELEYSRICLLETSHVENMAALFAFANVPRADLSKWDTSNVVNMEGMFYKSTYDSPSILGWNTKKCINFDNMFVGSKFSTDVKGYWDSGYILETVWSEDGKTPKMEPELDAEGKPTGPPKVVKMRVKAPLPEIGSHVVDINRKKDARILKALGDLEVKEKTTKKERYIEENKHILTIDEFVNEGFYDKFRSGIKKIKEKFNLFRIKINDYYVATFKKNNTTKNETNTSVTINGDVNIYTTMNYLAGHRVKGVSAFTKIESPLLNPNVESVAHIENKGDKYYGFLTKESREYKNFLYWIDTMEKVLLGGINEEKSPGDTRVSLSAKGSMLDALPDITSDQFKNMLRRIIHDNPAENDINEDSLATFIFGAPGIGKTTIPKAIINEFNKADENKTKKKSIIVIECGDLELGGFYLPMPDDTDMKNILEARPGLKKKLLNNYGFTDSDIENMKGVRVLKTEESPKTWLPVYKPSSDKHTQRAQTLVANSGTIKYKEWNEELGEFEEFIEDTFDGGIIMFDEFLRADEELFKTIMQLITKRETSGGYRIGSKWSIIACSNRPCDDKEVKDRFAKLAPAFGNRMSGGAFNYIPDFNEWAKWAKKSGYFDDDTLAFISQDVGTNKDEYDVIGKKGKTQKVVAYRRWHNLDTSKFHNMGPDNRMVFASPRSWANLMLWVHKQIKYLGLDSILDIDPGELKRQAIATIGLDIAEEYCTYMDRIREMGSKRPPIKDLFKKPVNIDTEVYDVYEAVKTVENFVSTNFKRSDIAETNYDKRFLQMAKNLEDAYGDLNSSHLCTLHRNIVVNIFKIRSEKYPEDEPLRKNLANYLTFVRDNYDINYADLDK